MQVYLWPTSIGGIILDVDETVYEPSPEYTRHQREVEFHSLARVWKTPLHEAKKRFRRKSKELAVVLGRPPSAAETIRALGFSQDWLMAIRQNWQPELFLTSNSPLFERVDRLVYAYDEVAFASTSPRNVILKVLEAVGLKAVIPKVKIFGGEDGIPKPSRQFFEHIARQLRLQPSECISIGDRYDFDAAPALEIGMGTVIISGMEDLFTVLDKLLNNNTGSLQIRQNHGGMRNEVVRACWNQDS